LLKHTKGYKKVLEELGLTRELVASSLVEDIKTKPQNRVGELRLASQILGMVDEQMNSRTNDVNINILMASYNQSKLIT
jgi:hypothetical protein